MPYIGMPTTAADRSKIAAGSPARSLPMTKITSSGYDGIS